MPETTKGAPARELPKEPARKPVRGDIADRARGELYDYDGQFDRYPHLFHPLREAAAIAFFADAYCEEAQMQLTSFEQEHVRFALRTIATKLAVVVHNEYERPVR